MVGLAGRQNQVKVVVCGDRVHIWVIGPPGRFAEDLLQFAACHQAATQTRNDRAGGNDDAGEQPELGNR
jgi:hypothetical protein